jgi:hypothetical protein
MNDDDQRLAERLRVSCVDPQTNEWAAAVEDRIWQRLTSTAGGSRPARSRKWMGRPRNGWLLCALLVVSATGIAVAATGLTNLGKSTPAVPTNPYFPLGGFHKTKLAPHVRKYTRVVFIGTGYDDRSAAERWPLVKALAQFGTFSNIAAAKQVCGRDPLVVTGTHCETPTFDMAHAHYSSRYLVLDYRDLLNDQAQEQGQPSKFELSLFNRYARTGDPHAGLHDAVGAAVNSQTERTLPIVVVGSYLQTASQEIFSADFDEQIPVRPSAGGTQTSAPSGLPFTTIHDALVSGHDPPGTNLNRDVNAEANLITALACHADGGRPRKVCDQAPIKVILKRVK